MTTNDTLTDYTACKNLMIDSARMLMLKISQDIELIDSHDFGDDDTDYMPARAETLSNIVAGLANSDMTPAEALAEFMTDSEGGWGPKEALDTTDFITPLLTYLTLHDSNYADARDSNRDALETYFEIQHEADIEKAIADHEIAIAQDED